MKDYELLDMIGEVDEGYVLAADSGVARPRFHWKAWAACAACAALALCAWPVWTAAQSGEDCTQMLEYTLDRPLHDYTVVKVEGGAALTQGESLQSAATAGDPPEAGGAPAPIVPGGADAGGGTSREENGAKMPSGAYGAYGAYEGDGPALGTGNSYDEAAVQEAAAARYEGLLRGLGGRDGYEPEAYPDWYGGAWIDNSCYPEARLTVAIVDGLRTPELEAQVEEWCGGEVAFQDVSYSRSQLDQLMTPVSEALEGTGLSCGIGVDVTENCLGVDICCEEIPEEALSRLAELDPEGDAIRVRLFTGNLDILSDEAVKGPAPGGTTEEDTAISVPPGVRETSQPASVEDGRPVQ